MHEKSSQDLSLKAIFQRLKMVKVSKRVLCGSLRVLLRAAFREK